MPLRGARASVRASKRSSSSRAGRRRLAHPGFPGRRPPDGRWRGTDGRPLPSRATFRREDSTHGRFHAPALHSLRCRTPLHLGEEWGGMEVAIVVGVEQPPGPVGWKVGCGPQDLDQSRGARKRAAVTGLTVLGEQGGGSLPSSSFRPYVPATGGTALGPARARFA